MKCFEFRKNDNFLVKDTKTSELFGLFKHLYIQLDHIEWWKLSESVDLEKSCLDVKEHIVTYRLSG